MGIVDHDKGMVAVGQLANLVEPGEGTIHAEHAVRCYETKAGMVRVVQLVFEFGHVVVGIAKPLGLTQTHSIDNARMIKRIADNGVVWPEQCFKQPAVGIETGRIQNRIVGFEKFAEAVLERFVQFLGAANKPHTCHTQTPGFQGIVGGLS